MGLLHAFYRLQNQPFKTIGETLIVLGRSLGGPFQMVLAACHPNSLGQVTLHQQFIDIVIGIPSAALVDCIRAFSQRHSGYTVILSHYEIAFVAQIDKGKIHCVRTGSDGSDFTVVRFQNVIGITKQNTRNAMRL